MSEPYVDIYLLPVRRDKLGEYRSQAHAFGSVAKEYGALSYREFLNDDPGENMGVEDGVVMTAAVVEFASRAHRDEVMGSVLCDPRIGTMTSGEDVADMSRMSYGGFRPLVTV